MYHDPQLQNEYKAWFLIRGFEFHPRELTKQIGIEPTDIKVKGEYRIVNPKTSHKMLNKENLWILYSSLPHNVPIEQHIEHLLNKIRPSKQNFIRIAKQYSLEFTCAIYYYEANPGINLTNKILREIAELGIELGLDIYCLAGAYSQFEHTGAEKELTKQLSQKKFISQLSEDQHNEAEVLANSLIEIDAARQQLNMDMETLVEQDDLTDEEYIVKFDKVTQDLQEIINSINKSKYLTSKVNKN